MPYRPVGLCLAAAALLLFVAVPDRAFSREMTWAYVSIEASRHEQFTRAVRELEDDGAVFRHMVYPYAAIGMIQEGSELAILNTQGVRQVFSGRIPDSALLALRGREAFVARAYNNIFFPHGLAEASFPVPDVEPVPIDPPPLTIPEEYLEELRDSRRVARAVPPPFPEATSEFMLGHIAVAAILPESEPGYGSHNWSRGEEDKTTEEIISAMDWWARHSPNQELVFSYEINYAVPVNIEPMEDGQNGIEHIWAGQSLTNLGYPGGNRFQQARDYINDMRWNFGADWGLVVYVLHGNPGQRFDMGALAYAYLGGPFNVNVFSNGYLGPSKLDRVIAHETGHTFYTLDEYPQAITLCSVRSGYLDVENANKQNGGAGCKSDVPCVMRGGSQPTPFDILEPCYYTRGQVGWWDSDGDGIPDILDTGPIVDRLVLDDESSRSGASVDTVFSGDVTFSGSVSAVPIKNKNRQSFVKGMDFTVEPVGAEYRLNGGFWTPCRPADGRFDSTFEIFEVTLTGLVPGLTHALEVRAVTAHGNVTADSAVVSAGVLPVFDSQPSVKMMASSPAKPPVSISFGPEAAPEEIGVMVSLEVYVFDPAGRKVKTLEAGEYQIGRLYSTTWDGKDSGGKLVPAGVYAIAMAYRGRIDVQKILVIP